MGLRLPRSARGPLVVVCLAATTFLSTPVAAQPIHSDGVFQQAGEIPKKETTWQVLPLGKYDSYSVCAFVSNDPAKRCRASFVLQSWVANSDAPLDWVQGFGGFAGTINVRDGFGIRCATSPSGEGFDYLVLRTDWRWKSCRKLKDGLGEVGVLSQGRADNLAASRGTLANRPLVEWRAPPL